MHLRTLGGLALEGTTFTRPKPLLLLAYLAIEGPQPRRRVADVFWPDGKDRRKSLSVALARLRKGAPGAVGADATRVWTTVGSDAEAFLERIEQGDAQGALELYPGSFLEGFDAHSWTVELEEWVFRTREFFAAHARQALLTLAEKEASEGRFAPAARFAEQAHGLADTSAEPSELARIHTLLVASGSPLAGAARKRAQEYDLELCSDASTARERLGKPDDEDDGGVPNNLPARGTRFVGRDLELTEVANELSARGPTFVTLAGPAGVGKSRLALQLAAEQLELKGFPDGVYVVALAPLTSSDAIPNAIADAVGIAPAPGGTLLETVVEGIGRRNILLVLDSFEHLIDGVHIVSRLARGCPGLGLLVTSRERLNLEEERYVPVRGLPYPDDGVDVAEALRFDAVKLYADRGRRANPEFAITEANLPAVVRTCRLVEGLPLGIELATAWLRALTPAAIADEIAKSPDFLVARTQNVPDRHRSLRRAFEHSWRLLTPHERQVLRRLSVFRGGFRRRAAGAVGGATIPDLASLVEKSLLRVDATGRYGRHPLLYQYMREKLAEHPAELEHVRKLHGRRYLELLTEQEDALVGRDQTRALARIEEELENVEEAWRWAVEVAAIEVLERACRPLQIFYIQHGGMDEAGVRAFGFAAERLEPRDERAQGVMGRIRAGEAWFRFRIRDFGRGAGAAEHALELLDPLVLGARPGEGDDPAEAWVRATVSARNTLGNIAKHRREMSEAENHFMAAMKLAQTWGHVRQRTILMNNVAGLRKAAGAYGEAETLYREALALNRSLGNLRSVVRNLTNLGATYVLDGRIERAVEVLEEGRELANSVGYDAILPDLLFNLGAAACEAGDHERARRLCEEALDRRGEESNLSFAVEVRCWLARSAGLAGDHASARGHYRRAIESAWANGEHDLVLEALVGMADLFARVGLHERAARMLSRLPRRPAVAPRTEETRRRLEQEVLDGRADRGEREPALGDAVVEALRQVSTT